jgi:hypothetical protein
MYYQNLGDKKNKTKAPEQGLNYNVDGKQSYYYPELSSQIQRKSHLVIIKQPLELVYFVTLCRVLSPTCKL